MRRRKPRVVWLPQDPFFAIDSQSTAGSTVMRATDSLSGAPAAGVPGNSVTFIAPVVRDAPPNPLTATNSLADINESGYRLRRIVGKFWCFATQTPADDTSPGAACVTAAFIILRVDSTATGTPLNTGITPATIVDTEAPWIWRRSWIVVNNGSLNSIPFGDNNTAANAPTALASNQNLGGNADGAHIDQKTARIVGPDERLFLVVTATDLTGASDIQDPMVLDYVWDVRVLASMRSNVGNRRNASR